MDDRSLMEAMQAGRSEALAGLFDRHAPALLALCVRILREKSDAEDVVEEVFFELWRRPERYDAERGSPLAYLLVLARSRALDHLRARRRRTESTLLLGHASEFEPLLWRAPEDTPLHQHLAAERRARIRSALEQLPPEQRTAIHLSFFEGLTQSQIAAQLGEPLGTIKTRMRRGLIRLRQLLAESEALEVA